LGVLLGGEVQPESLHQRIGLVFGSAEEVERIERYHNEVPQDTYRSPLFGSRGLFSTADESQPAAANVR